MKTIGRAAAAEVRALLKDPAPLVVLIGSVLIYSLLYPTPYLNRVLKGVSVAVVDLDQSALSRKLTRLIDAHELTDVKKILADPKLAAAQVRAGEISGFIVIPNRFERDLLRGEHVTVGEFADASNLLTYRQLSTGVMAATKTLSGGIEIRRLTARGTPLPAAQVRQAPVTFEMRSLDNCVEGYDAFIVPAVFLLILQQTLLIGIGMHAGGTKEDRPNGAIALGANEGTSAALILGRAGVYVGLYYVHLLYYFGIVCPFHGFGGPLPAVLRVMVFCFPFLLAVTFCGLALGCLWLRRETPLQILMFTSIPTAFLAGFAWPVEAIPGWLRIASAVIPSTPGIAGLVRLLRMRATLSDVAWEWGNLWALAGLYFALAMALAAGEKRRARGERGLNAERAREGTQAASPA